MKRPHRLRVRAIKAPKGHASKGLRASILSVHRLHAGHKTANPRKKFLAKVQTIKLRTFGVARAGTHLQHGHVVKPKAPKSHLPHRRHRKAK